MDDDDDFFDMRARIRVPAKGPVRPKYDEEGLHSGSSSSSSEDEDPPEVRPPKRPIINKSGPSSRKKRKPVISLDSDESDDGVDKSSPEKATPKRNREISLTPPPILGAEAIRQAMTVIQEHQDHGHGRPNTRQMASLSSSQNPLKSDSLDSDDDTDITPYKSTINPEIAKQAARLAPQSKAPVAKPEVIKLVIYLVGRRNGDDSLPQDWETPVGFNILSSMSFSKLKAEFLNKKGYNKDVVLAFRDFQLFYGSPQEKNMKEGDKIYVYSQKSWESFKDEKRRKLDRKEEDVVSLSSDDELAKPVPSVRLNLQCDAASAVHIRVQKTMSVKTLVKLYRNKANIPSGKKVTLTLDGDELAENRTVGQCDLDDEDILDVQLADA